ncbi:MAG: imidazoleglycerol-phosphate dehydratase HisB [Hydrotalea sp.]|nr:imidazoleglycerol-phosphate dehydratase HisB [Hydrotalea sp.]
MRTATITRQTKETDITATVNLDGTGVYNISTGIGFLDHMLEQLSRHSLIDINLTCKGDLHIDNHHTAEDCGIVLGQVMLKALSDKKGIARFGDALSPMDDTLTEIAVDICGRGYLVWQVEFSQDKLGEMEVELFREWFHAFAMNLGANIHVVNRHGLNNHHKIESAFKGLARSLRQAVTLDGRQAGMVASTKGKL